jgi:5'-AMP-activated protein kinase regulatory beta subunit
MYEKGRKKGLTRFALRGSDGARRAELAGSFNDWSPQPMRKNNKGEFVLNLPLQAGTYEYKFLVDGNWTLDPDNADMAMNALGTFNSVATVPGA